MTQTQQAPTRSICSILHAILLGGLLLTAAGTRVATAAPPTPDLSQTRLHIVLRTAGGQPVPGIAVEIVPAAADLGGLEGGSTLPPMLTAADGGVIVTGLGRWIWMVRFRGQFQGQPLQSVALQGQAPWGRTRAGGGFPLQVQAQEEDSAPTPVVVAGTPQPDTQTTSFVLLPSNGTWAVTLDLGDPLGTPQPLAGDTAQTDGAERLPAAGDAATTRPGAAPPLPERPPSPLGWWIAAGGLWLLGYGLYTWRRWHTPPPTALPATADRAATTQGDTAP